MKFLCATDLHGELQAKEMLLKFASEHAPDAVVLCGDISDGSVAFVEDLFESLEAEGIEFYAVHGNIDPDPVREFIGRSRHGVHGRCVDLGKVTLCGIGGSPPTPFGTPNECSEEEIAKVLDGLGNCGGPNCLLASHFPPKDCEMDKTNTGVHVGSSALAKFISEKKPAVVACGHVHERQGVEKIGSTIIAKIAPLMRGNAALVSVPDLGVEFLSARR